MRTFIPLFLIFMACLTTSVSMPQIVAHRGASRDAPENTIPAFRLAWEQGADAIEGDFHLTEDGAIVCIHDGNTKKVADQNLVVRESSLAELKALDVGASFGADFKGTTIPTIAEVFATMPPGKTIYVEIKSGPEIIPALLDEIERSGLATEQVVVISFERAVIQAVKASAPQFKAFWLCSFRKNDAGRVRPKLEFVLSTLAEMDADGLSANFKIPEAFVAAVQEKGFDWHVWTVNDSTTAKRMQAWGARSITTDVPGLLRRSFAE
jgi:glycerophosphoryl diester phosphodiesterase